MKSRWALNLIALSSLTLLPAISLAANANQDTATPDKSAKVRRVTGCLSTGDSEHEYLLTSSSGATWEVKSDAVKFSDHVGHTVTLTGTVNNATAHGVKEKAKDKTMDNPAEHGHMTVTHLKMVSESCNK